jgi:Predicted glycosyl hydrolase
MSTLKTLRESERDSYSDFVRILREVLPAEKSLSIAVAPKPYSVEAGWQKSYDYAALAQYCDYLMLMTYDQSYQGGPEGPVASARFVEDSIKSALKEVPAQKIVLGLAFYGRYWKQGSTYGGYGISAYHVEDLIKKYRGVVTYDKVYQSPKAVITIKEGDVKPYVFGSPLQAGKYTIWYENEQSIKYKLTLVQEYNLKGAGSWSLGQESLQTWKYYKLWLNGFYF